MATNGRNQPRNAPAASEPNAPGFHRASSRASMLVPAGPTAATPPIRRWLVVLLLGTALLVNLLRLGLAVFAGAGAAYAWDNPAGSPFCNNVAAEDEAVTATLVMGRDGDHRVVLRT